MCVCVCVSVFEGMLVFVSCHVTECMCSYDKSFFVCFGVGLCSCVYVCSCVCVCVCLCVFV